MLWLLTGRCWSLPDQGKARSRSSLPKNGKKFLKLLQGKNQKKSQNYFSFFLFDFFFRFYDAPSTLARDELIS